MKDYYLKSLLTKTVLTFSFATILGISQSFAEGSKELLPASTDRGYIYSNGANQAYGRFAHYTDDTARRLYINICNLGEKVFFGFRLLSNMDAFVRIKDPNGNIVFGPVQIRRNNQTAAPGRIETYNEAIIGPNTLAAGGYNPLSFVPLMTGNYYVEFNRNSATVSNTAITDIQFFDFTVRDTINNITRTGRLWSRAWNLNQTNFGIPFNGTMYMYAPDGITTNINFNGMEPYVFVVSANGRGCVNTGNGNLDRQSRAGNFTYPEYPIFLNPPDTLCFPTGILGALTDSVRVTGCDPANRCIEITVNKAGLIDIILDLNGIPGYQPNSRDLIISTQVDSGYNCIPWNSLDGLGNIVIQDESFPVLVDYFNGLTHLPLYDVENHRNGFIVNITRPPGPKPRMFWDDSQLPSGTTELFIGCILAGGCHDFPFDTPPTSSTGFGDVRTINSWWFASVLRDSTSIPGSVIYVTTNTNNPPYTPNDTTICSNAGSIQLFGGVFGSTQSGLWTSLSPNPGTFTPSDTVLGATYVLSPSEESANQISLVLQSTNNAGCPPKFDTITINLSPGPQAIAPPGDTVCYNNPTINLTGSFSNGVSAYWSGGGGTFAPDSLTLSTFYVPTQSEIDSGFALLILTAVGNPPCGVLTTDTTRVTIIDPLVVIAGADGQVCKNNPAYQLSGTVIGATGGRWVGGAGSYSPNDSTLNAVYTPTPAEVASGQLVLRLESIGNGLCNSERDTIVINFVDPPTVDGGGNQSVCDFFSTVNLSGSVTPGFTASWSGSNGSFNPPDSLNTVYNLTSQDTAAGQVQLFLTSDSLNGCLPVTDTVIVTLIPTPRAIINNNNPASVCLNNPSITLSGTTTMGAGFNWIGGGGTFSPSNTVPNPTYILSELELGIFFTSIILETTGVACTPTSDTILVFVLLPPNPNAGPDDSVCKNNPTVQLNGSFILGSIPSWSGGTGVFSNDSIINPTYTPSASEIANGSTTLYFTVGDALCNPVTDTVRINFTDPPVVDAGPDQTICRNNDMANLSGSVQIATGGIWTGNGGTFQPNNTALNGNYFATQAEKNSDSTFLILTSTGNGNCLPVSDTVIINFSPDVTVNAGPDVTVCKSIPAVTLNGVITNVPGNPGSWVGGGGNFSPNRNSMTATYTPTSSEIDSGFVRLILRSRSTASCDHVYDTMFIFYINDPTADAGPSVSVCRDNPLVSLSGTVTVATGGSWSGGNGNFSNPNSLNTSYNPTLAELNSGSVMLILTSTGNGGCIPGIDSVTITYTPTVTVNAGPSISICTGVPNVTLNGSVTVAGGGKWTTSGSGNFTPHDSALNATYVPSNADRLAGSVFLTLTTINFGTCNPKSDSLTITFLPNPTIDAGPDQTVCTNDYPVQLNATGSSGAWVGGTTAGFSPNRSALNATYTPTAGELASGTLTLIYATAASANCIVVRDTVIITLLPGPLANAGGPINVCADNDSIQLAGTVTNALGGTWTTMGSGLFSPNPNLLNAKYTPSNTDKNNGIVRLVLTVPPGGGCSSVNDTLIINIAPRVGADAGPNQSICEDVIQIPLNGQVTTATGGIWNSPGGGSFTPNANTLTANYAPTITEKNNGSATLILTSTGNGLCQAVSDTVIYTFTPSPTVNVGNDTSVCATATSIPLSGSVTIASGGIWSGSGSGTFSPNAALLNTNYFFDTTDKQNGQVIIRLQTTGNGDCNPRTDSLVVTITPRPVAEAGPDQSVCADIDSIILNGTVFHATGGRWISSGTGSFFPNANTLNARYVPTTFDRLAGFVTLTLITTGNGICDSVFDRLDVVFTPAPTSFAGIDIIICETTDTVGLTGTATNAASVLWTTNGTGTLTNPNSSSGFYLPSAGDISAGTVQFIFTANGNGSCVADRDTISLTINPAPSVSAGPDRSICADSIGISLNAVLANALNVQWTTNGTGGFFPKSDTINNSYVPSTQDRSNGQVRIIVTTTGNGPCAADIDTLNLTILPLPTVNPGPNQTVCADTTSIQLNGSVTNATGGYWVASGTGTFLPDSSALNGTYVPSQNDKLAGNVRLSLYTSGTGLCRQVNNFIDITITPSPTFELGPNVNICADQPSVPLQAQFTIASGMQWTSSGTGIFLPDSLTNSTSYFPSLSDRSNGTVQLFGRTTGNGLCRARFDTLLLTISPIPTVNAGPDRNVCVSTPNVLLAGNTTNSLGGVWTSNVAGAFSPNNTNPNATFTPAVGITSGKVFYTNTGSGVCAARTDSMSFVVTPVATVNAGQDDTVCTSFPDVRLFGTYSNADSIRWTSSGTGNFVPRNDTVTDYDFSNNDLLQNFITVTLTAFTNGICPNVSDFAVIRLIKKPTVTVGSDFQVCKSLDSIALFASTAHSTGGVWSSNGTGTFLPNSNQTQVWYIPSVADTSAGSVTFTYEVFGAFSCANQTDDVIVTFVSALTVDAGGPIDTVCTTSLPINLNGSGTTGTWSGGTGTFNPSANVLNAIYTPSAAEVNAGSVKLYLTSPPTGACASVVDSVIYIIPEGPEANAGTNVTVCADTSGVPILGIISNATQAVWTTSGSGSFQPNPNALAATYIPSASDLGDSVIVLTLTTLDAEPCVPAVSQKVIYINPAPSVFAGLDKQLCRDVDTIALQATFQRAAGVRWVSSGTGTFVPHDSASSVKYVPSIADRDSITLRFIVSTFGNGLCKLVRDTVEVTLTPSVTLDLGNDFAVCADENTFNLNASFTVASGISWSVVAPANGNLLPSAFVANPSYSITNADRTRDSIVFRATTLINGGCLPAFDSIVVFIQQPPTVDAGSNSDVCFSANSVQLNGSTTGANGGVWATSGSGTFSPNDSTLNASYVLSAADKTAGAVNLSLTTTGTGACAPVTDFTSIFIFNLPSAIVNAGLDQFLCRDVNTVGLFGLVINAQGGVWSSSGAGIFIPNAFSLNATYVPTLADKNNGSVEIYLTSIGTGVCDVVTDTMTAFFTPPPTVDAGPDTAYCIDVLTIPLAANITVANGAIWSTPNGSGSFAPSSGLAVTNYLPSANDRLLNSITFNVVTDGNGTCLPRTDFKIISFIPRPIVNPGSNRNICANVDSIQLNATVQNATGGVWTSSGSGTFVPNNTSLNAIYAPTAAEIASGTTVLILSSTGSVSCSPKDTALIINYISLPQIDAGVDELLCNSVDTINLSGFINTSQNTLWQSTGSGSFVPDAFVLNPQYIRSGNDTAAITFTLKTTNGVCVNITDNKIVNYQPVPGILIGPQNACLDSGFVQLFSSITNGAVQTWFTSGTGSFSPNTFVNNPHYFPSANDLDLGRIDVSIATVAGICPSDTGTISLSLFDLPFADAGLDRLICRGASLTLNGTTNAIGSPTAWLTSNGTLITATDQVTITANSDTSFIFEVIDFLGCRNIDTIKVFVIDPPTLNLPVHLCFYDTIVLNSSPQNLPSGGGFFQWYKSDTLLPGQNDTTILATNSGYYKVIYNLGSCFVEDSSNVSLPPFSAIPDRIVCNSSQDTIITINLPNGSFIWSEDGNVLGGQTTNVLIYSANNSSLVDQVFSVTLTDSLGCVGNDTVLVRSTEIPILDLNDTALCQGSFIILNGSPTNIQDSIVSVYTWFRNNALLQNETTNLLNVQTTGMYSLIYALGKCVVSDTANVQVNPNPIVVLPERFVFCPDEQPTVAINAGIVNQSYQWFGPGTSPSDTLQVVNVSLPGIFNVLVTNQFGCSAEDSTLVVELCDPKIFNPTGFTPGLNNGNNPNAIFRVFGKYFTDFSMSVFNRWGEIIFYAEDINEGWDGTYRGEPMPEGTYPVLIKYRGLTEGAQGPFKVQTSVTLIR